MPKPSKPKIHKKSNPSRRWDQRWSLRTTNREVDLHGSLAPGLGVSPSTAQNVQQQTPTPLQPHETPATSHAADLGSWVGAPRAAGTTPTTVGQPFSDQRRTGATARPTHYIHQRQ